MALPSTVVEQRARFLARLKLIVDLSLAAAFYFGGAPLLFLIAPALDAVLLLPYLRFLRRAPAILTLGSLALSAVLLALSPFALPPVGLALWLLYPLLPLLAAFVLGRRTLTWLMAGISSVIAIAASLVLLTSNATLTLDLTGIAALLAALAVTLWGAAWLVARTLQPDRSSLELLGPSLTIVRGVLVVPFNWVVGGVQSETLQMELYQLKRRNNPRWIVLDLAPAGELGRNDLNAIDKAAAATTTAHCTVVLARPPVDATGHLDVARPMVGRVERYATVPQAVEAGLRRLGWSNPAEKREADPLSLM